MRSARYWVEIQCNLVLVMIGLAWLRALLISIRVVPNVVIGNGMDWLELRANLVYV